MRGIFTLFGTVFLLVGLAMLVVVAIVTVNSLNKAGGIRVEGVVIEARDNQKPVVEFRTREGQRVRVEGSISASPTPYRVGERIGVFYDPADPSAAMIDSFLERWFTSVLFGGFAAVFSLIGAGFTIAALRRRDGAAVRAAVHDHIDATRAVLIATIAGGRTPALRL